jgi:hypothetical protein
LETSIWRLATNSLTGTSLWKYFKNWKCNKRKSLLKRGTKTIFTQIRHNSRHKKVRKYKKDRLTWTNRWTLLIMLKIQSKNLRS